MIPTPPSNAPLPISSNQQQITTVSSSDLVQAINKLKKPTSQHIVDFKERYEQALRREKEDNEHQLHCNRRFIFNYETSQWIRFQMQDYANIWLPHVQSFPSHLKILSLNVWFARILQQVRYTTQLNLFQELDLDIICLQEVIPDYIEEFVCKNDFIRKNYIISDMDGTSVEPYGVMMMVKKTLPLLDMKITELTTRMGRKLIHATFTKDPILDLELMTSFVAKSSNGGGPVPCQSIIPCHAIISTVHLESLASKDRRKTQLSQIHSVLEFHTSSKLKMLMGDFNFDSETSENRVNLKEGPFSNFEDVWLKVNPEGKSTGKTFEYKGTHHKGDRLDRMMMRSEEWQPLLMKLVGNQAIQLKEEELSELERHGMQETCMSDHYGIYAELLDANTSNVH